jgi:hypothetical protein
MPFKYLENVSHIWEFREAKKDVLKAQERLLLGIVKKNKNTVYGKKYGFSKIKSIGDFQKRVPIISYEDIIPLIERIKLGEKNVLTKDKVVFFATTSGTTKKAKLIPITPQRIISFKKELSLWSFKFLRTFPKVLKGKLLYFAGPYEEGRTSAGIMYGSISGYLVYKSSWFVKRKLVVPPRLYNEFDFDRKIKEIAKLSIRSNVTQLGFAFPVEVLMFLDYVEKNKDLLLKEIKDEGHWFKARILAKKRFKPKYLWPDLTVVNCIKSHQNRPYIEELEKRLPGVLINDPGIYSSEGRISLCLKPGAEAGILPATINFFEFKEQGFDKVLLASDLEVGRKYEVILTTAEGLYRYEMGDVVEVVGFRDSIPLIKFYERSNFLNIAGELAHEKVLIDSMEEVLSDFNLKLRGFTFMPFISTSTKPCYNILIEPIKPLDKVLAKKFIKALDAQIQKNINDYMQMRNEFGRIGFPRLSIAKKGGYDAFDKSRMSRGGQQKPIVLSKDADFINNFDIVLEIKG